MSADKLRTNSIGWRSKIAHLSGSCSVDIHTNDESKKANGLSFIQTPHAGESAWRIHQLRWIFSFRKGIHSAYLLWKET